MSTLILLRHGRSQANGAGTLAGRTPGVPLDELGRAQAAALVQRLSACRLTRIVSSPMARCRATVTPLAEARDLQVKIDDRLQEVDYGDWTGRGLATLADEPLWRTVQTHPAAVTFPGGEALADAAHRATSAARDIATALAPGESALVCSHGDIIKAIIADALGLHLDLFQRIVVTPASLSVVRYDTARAYVIKLNDAGTLACLDGAAQGTNGAVIGGETGIDADIREKTRPR